MTTAQITPAMVKRLREETSAGMMDCKRVLEETSGDHDEAVKLLRERGMAQAGKLAGRATTEGRVESYIEGGKVGVLLEVGCNTDFVARNDDFQSFVAGIARHVADNDPADVAALLAQPNSAGSGSIEDLRAQTSASTGENVEIRRFVRWSTDGLVGAYVHGGKIGVLVEAAGGQSTEVQEFVRELAMHIAAMNPRWLNRDEVPAEAIAAEKEIYIAQAADKPEHIREKIAEGKLNSWLKDVALMDQLWVRGKDVYGKDTSIEAWRAQVSASTGENVEIRRFTRFALGDGAVEGSGDEA